ncbi:MAG: hypothetical protein ACYDHM_15225, partial [Acidiferrobacterales bacterium]
MTEKVFQSNNFHWDSSFNRRTWDYRSGPFSDAKKTGAEAPASATSFFAARRLFAVGPLAMLGDVEAFALLFFART